MPRVRQRRTRRRRERLLLITLAVLTCVFALATLVSGYVVWRLEQVERLAVAGSLTMATPEPLTAAQLVAEAPGAAEESVDERPPALGFEDLEVARPDRPAENYLLVGSDSVEGVGADEEIMVGRDDQVGNTLADTIMVLRIRPDGSAAVVSIPRDLLVQVAGTVRTAKVNSAFNLDPTPAGRASRLIDTVEEHLGIELQHFVEVDLDGFRRLVDAIGGVEVCFESAIRDRNTDDSGNPLAGGTGFAASPGPQVLDGERALQYVRSRRLYVQADDGDFERLGYWNDIERAARQQQFLFDAVDQALDDALSSPGTLRSILDIVAANLRTSDTISLFDDGFDLARLFRGFDAETGLERYAFELRDVEQNGQAGLALRAGEHNDRVLDVFRGIGWDDVVEQRVSVRVVGDGSSAIAQALGDVGFVIAGRFGSGEQGDRARLRYGVGGQQAAVMVASHLRGAVDMVGDPTLAGNEVVLDLGGADAPEIGVSADYRTVTLPPAVAAVPAVSPDRAQDDDSGSATGDADNGNVLPAPPVAAVPGLCS